ncbi:MAG: MarR family winged helix-turn-helix transcriptional regulator [Candidatus Endonucleobacter bathymodioli]|uniref:MarR family winged helix-turn-helix transcriptional regulator n=1 Tax=Candidatus Endonucleibacter bathymodioli TaxID=539814 RepID=A0AA90NP02_9GAMM|nr:MarR family winged helix-turn-helix transcriptional regulator [Candidatus Endonucleobacter bathymodioli]
MTLQSLIKLTQLLKETPLTVIQWQILLVVADNTGETITDLVNDEKLRCGTPSDIAVSVKRLGEGRHDRPGLGLIKKTAHPDDGRYFKLALSPKGKRLITNIKKKIRNLE